MSEELRAGDVALSIPMRLTTKLRSLLLPRARRQWSRQRAGAGPDLTRVFVSYRRRDQAVAAHNLHRILGRVLTEEFGLPPRSVFIDEQDIGIGHRVDEAIEAALSRSEIILVVIGAHWLEPDGSGRSRLDDADDHVRREIELALKFGLHVVPVLVADTRMPTADQLPECLAELAGRNAIRLRPSAFDSDAADAAHEIGSILGSGLLE